MTAYNWETNASNAGSDYRFQNDAHLSGSDTPGAALTAMLTGATAIGATAMLTIPIVDYVAGDKNGDGDVQEFGRRLPADALQAEPGHQGRRRSPQRPTRPTPSSTRTSS